MSWLDKPADAQEQAARASMARLGYSQAQPAAPQPSFRLANDAVAVNKIGRPTGQMQPRAQAPSYQGNYDTGYGGIHGEAAEESRGLQVDALGMYRNAATGNAPSVAQTMMQQGLDRASAAQQSAAASARGPAALAAAQRQAAWNMAGVQQGGVGQMAALRAQEMDQARQGYMQGTGMMRGQDLSRFGMDLQQGTAQAGLQAQNQAGRSAHAQAQGGAGLGLINTGIGIGRYGHQAAMGEEAARQQHEQATRQAAFAEAERTAKARAGGLGMIANFGSGALSTVGNAMTGGMAGGGGGGGVGGAGFSGGSQAGAPNRPVQQEAQKAQQKSSYYNPASGDGTDF